MALNFALKERAKGKSVVIVDIDIVNPYFRTNDVADILGENGIRLVTNGFASSNVDMPVVPCTAAGVFETDEEIVIFDMGGDDDGAYAIGQYSEYFKKYGYYMHLVFNAKRPLTPDAKSIFELAQRIETASRLHFSDIYNNTNLAGITDREILMSGIPIAEELSEMMNIPIAYHCGTRDVVENFSCRLKTFEINIIVKMPF